MEKVMKLKREVEEERIIQIPSYYTDGCHFWKVCEDKVLSITNIGGHETIGLNHWSLPFEIDNNIPQEITKEEFEFEFEKVLNILTKKREETNYGN